MTGNELARRTGTYGQASLSERQQYALALSRAADLLPKNYWDQPKMVNGQMAPAQVNPGKVLYMTETAAMLGIHPMAGLTNIHIIEGKPTLSASLWAALVREAGHKLRIRVEGEGEKTVVIAQLVRADDPDFTFEVKWSYADAQRAGLLNKDNWKKYFRAMLKSRAIVEVIREGAPEVGMGAAYTPEELNPNIVVGPDGEPLEMSHVPEHREAPRSEPQAPRQAPVMADPTPEPAEAESASEAATEDVDWNKLIADATTADELRALYHQARQAGVLDLEIKQGRKTRKLSVAITEAGQALAKKEEERVAAEAQAPAEEYDPDVVVATIVEDDDKPMAMGD